jgi:hypothetical protein
MGLIVRCVQGALLVFFDDFRLQSVVLLVTVVLWSAIVILKLRPYSTAPDQIRLTATLLIGIAIQSIYVYQSLVS